MSKIVYSMFLTEDEKSTKNGSLVELPRWTRFLYYTVPAVHQAVEAEVDRLSLVAAGNCDTLCSEKKRFLQAVCHELVVQGEPTLVGIWRAGTIFPQTSTYVPLTWKPRVNSSRLRVIGSGFVSGWMTRCGKHRQPKNSSRG